MLHFHNGSYTLLTSVCDAEQNIFSRGTIIKARNSYVVEFNFFIINLTINLTINSLMYHQ